MCYIPEMANMKLSPISPTDERTTINSTPKYCFKTEFTYILILQTSLEITTGT